MVGPEGAEEVGREVTTVVTTPGGEETLVTGTVGRKVTPGGATPVGDVTVEATPAVVPVETATVPCTGEGEDAMNLSSLKVTGKGCLGLLLLLLELIFQQFMTRKGYELNDNKSALHTAHLNMIGYEWGETSGKHQ